MSATAATARQNKEGLIISDGNSRINNRGLARKIEKGSPAEEGEREREAARGSRLRRTKEKETPRRGRRWLIYFGAAKIWIRVRAPCLKLPTYKLSLSLQHGLSFSLTFAFFVSPYPSPFRSLSLSRRHPLYISHPIHRAGRRKGTNARLRRLVDELRKVRLCLPRIIRDIYRITPAYLTALDYWSAIIVSRRFISVSGTSLT